MYVHHPSIIIFILGYTCVLQHHANCLQPTVVNYHVLVQLRESCFVVCHAVITVFGSTIELIFKLAIERFDFLRHGIGRTIEPFLLTVRESRYNSPNTMLIPSETSSYMVYKLNSNSFNLINNQFIGDIRE
jgi:hypothetical protein